MQWRKEWLALPGASGSGGWAERGMEAGGHWPQLSNALSSTVGQSVWAEFPGPQRLYLGAKSNEHLKFSSVAVVVHTFSWKAEVR